MMLTMIQIQTLINKKRLTSIYRPLVQDRLSWLISVFFQNITQALCECINQKRLIEKLSALLHSSVKLYIPDLSVFFKVCMKHKLSACIFFLFSLGTVNSVQSNISPFTDETQLQQFPSIWPYAPFVVIIIIKSSENHVFMKLREKLNWCI